MLSFFLCIVIIVNMQLEQFKTDIIPLRSMLYFSALKIVENEDEAEDIVQEVMLRLWSMRGQLTSVQNTKGFTVTMTKNICIDRVRMRKQTVDINEYSLNNEGENPYSSLENQDSVNIVRSIIDRLPELQKIIIRMRDIEGYELKEIAEITGTTISAVTVNLSRARKRVREEYIGINKYKRL
ncbi:RNA polymerase sigma factor [Bacteroidales bacterium OttesenSCG-928-I14]|nr:RNA polymerase sigma factor [Bacteroidales bacterium OttesenSCG-928-I14]